MTLDECRRKGEVVDDYGKKHAFNTVGNQCTPLCPAGFAQDIHDAHKFEKCNGTCLRRKSAHLLDAALCCGQLYAIAYTAAAASC